MLANTEIAVAKIYPHRKFSRLEAGAVMWGIFGWVYKSMQKSDPSSLVWH
jgi:hypothetical protein